jgi:hypothetical protein
MTMQTYFLNVYKDRFDGKDCLEIQQHFNSDSAKRELASYIAQDLGHDYIHTIVRVGDNVALLNLYRDAEDFIESNCELSELAADTDARDTAVQEQNYWDSKND